MGCRRLWRGGTRCHRCIRGRGGQRKHVELEAGYRIWEVDEKRRGDGRPDRQIFARERLQLCICSRALLREVFAMGRFVRILWWGDFLV